MITIDYFIAYCIQLVLQIQITDDHCTERHFSGQRAVTEATYPVNNILIYRTWGSFCCLGDGCFDTGSRPTVVVGLNKGCTQKVASVVQP